MSALDILFTPAEERFDRITRLAARTLNMEFAFVSLVARECQWFKSRYGLNASETPREISFCAHAILAAETLVVEDARADERFFDNPLVIGMPHIRGYAGHPLCTENGSRVGTLCVASTRARVFTPEELDALRDFAALVEDELQRKVMGETQLRLIRERQEWERRATVDSLTHMWNRPTVLELAAQEFLCARVEGHAINVGLIDIDHFKRINDGFGHPAGDEALAEVASRIRQALRLDDISGRYGGEEFLILLRGGAGEARAAAERVRAEVGDESRPMEALGYTPTVSIGLASLSPADDRIEQVIKRADVALYRAKANGRNRVEDSRCL